MKKLTWLFYLFYIPGVTLLFLYWQFPATHLKAFILRQANQALPGLSVACQGLSPALPPALDIRQIELDYPPYGQTQIQRMAIHPIWHRLVRAQAAFRIKAWATQQGGALTADIIAGSPPQLERLVVSDFPLNAITWGPALLLTPTSGLIDATASYAFTDNQHRGQATLELTKLQVNLPPLAPGLDTLAFNLVSAEIEWTGSSVQIHACQFSGRQADGNISGKIMISRRVLPNSRLQLSGDIKLHPELIAAVGKSVLQMVFPGKSLTTGPIAFTIGGTIDRPTFRTR